MKRSATGFDITRRICDNPGMSTPRIILCLDLDAFYASVEELLHPEWKGLPLLVGGRPEERGVVSSCSYAARKFGIHSATPRRRRSGFARKPSALRRISKPTRTIRSASWPSFASMAA